MVRLSSGLQITPAMMTHQISLDLTFEPSIGLLARRVDKLGVDVRSFREPLKRIIQRVIIPSIRTNFDVGGRPAWADLAEGTIRQKKTNQKLVESGRLRRVGTQLNIWHIDREKAAVLDLPSSIWYGKVQQAGMEASASKSIKLAGTSRTVDVEEQGSGGIPARPWLVIQESDIAQMDLVMSEWLQERIVAAGLV